MENSEYINKDNVILKDLLEEYKLVILYHVKCEDNPFSCIAKYRFKRQAKRTWFIAEHLADTCKHIPLSLDLNTIVKTSEIISQNVKNDITNMMMDLPHFGFNRLIEYTQIMYNRFVFYHICLTRYIIKTLTGGGF